MALANYTFSTNLYSVLLEAASQAGTTKDGLLLAFQGNGAGSQATAKSLLAMACNRIHDQLVYGNPKLNQASADFDLEAGTLEYDCPEDMMRCEQDKWLYIGDDDESQAQRIEIEYASPNDFDLLWGVYQQPNGNATYFPRNWTLIPDATKIRFSSFQCSGTYRLYYRTEVALWTAADVTSTTSTTYADIPDTFIDVLAGLIAITYLARVGNFARKQSVKEELYEVPRGSRTKRARYDELTRTLAQIAAANERQYQQNNLPHTSQTPLRFGGANSANGLGGTSVGGYGGVISG